MITECNCFIKSPNSLESFYIILLGIVLFSLVLVFSLSSCYGQCYNWIKVFKNGPSDKAAGCLIQGLLIGILFYSVPHFDVDHLISGKITNPAKSKAALLSLVTVQDIFVVSVASDLIMYFLRELFCFVNSVEKNYGTTVALKQNLKLHLIALKLK